MPTQSIGEIGLPPDTQLPMFAYGIFRPGQIAHFQIREFVERHKPDVEASGGLWDRDGLPLFVPNEYGFVTGSLLFFRTEGASDAYGQIRAMRPGEQYEWGTLDLDGTTANVLVGRHHEKGGQYAETSNWNSWGDQLFSSAIEVVREVTDAALGIHEDLRPLFEVHMAYLLLWTSIERYASFRYDLTTDPMQKLKRVAEEQAFANSLQQNVNAGRSLCRAYQPRKREVLNPNNPKRSMNYYYAVRSNAAHRGKMQMEDFFILRQSTRELLAIFEDILSAAKREARTPSR